MADKKNEEKKGKEGGAAADGAPKEKKPLPKAVLIAAIIGGAIIIQSGIFMVVLNNMKAKAVVTPEQVEVEEAKKAEEEKAAEAGGAQASPIADSTKLFYKVEDLIINPLQGGRRLLAVSVTLEFRDEAGPISAKARDGQIRDVLIKTLSAKPVDELQDIMARDHLKLEMVKGINEAFGAEEDVVIKLYISNFVLQ
ncbi:MAG: flagellar basal body-associated FliL family protein [Fibrobacteres bacterium]|nr:flagellar basal body-associated FliL family protein [Fibrobacterota bacterium]